MGFAVVKDVKKNKTGGLNGREGHWCRTETTCRDEIKARDPDLYKILKKIWSPKDQRGWMLACSSKAILLKESRWKEIGCNEKWYNYCQKRAKEGECESNPNEMGEKCAKSCEIDRWKYADFPSKGECD